MAAVVEELPSPKYSFALLSEQLTAGTADLTAWYAGLNVRDNIGLLATVFSSAELPEVKPLMMHFPTVRLFDVLNYAIAHDTVSFEMIAYRCVIELKRYINWELLLTYAEKRPDVVACIQGILNQHDYAPIGVWITQEAPPEPTETDTETTVQGAMFNYLTQGIRDLLKDSDEFGDVIDMATAGILTSGPDNMRADRLFGPVNAMIDLECSTGRKGGCRMLTCCCYEKNPSECEPYDWFDGSCDNCYRKIRHYSHCVRFPVNGGGFKGCFCSIECIDDHTLDMSIADNFVFNRMIDALAEHNVLDQSNQNK